MLLLPSSSPQLQTPGTAKSIYDSDYLRSLGDIVADRYFTPSITVPAEVGLSLRSNKLCQLPSLVCTIQYFKTYRPWLDGCCVDE